MSAKPRLSGLLQAASLQAAVAAGTGAPREVLLSSLVAASDSLFRASKAASQLEGLLDKISELVAEGTEIVDAPELPLNILEEIAMYLQVAGYGVLDPVDSTYTHGVTVTPEQDETVHGWLRRRSPKIEKDTPQ